MAAQTEHSTHALEWLTWFMENWKRVAIVAVGAVVLIGGYYLYLYQHEQHEAEASRALTDVRSLAERGAGGAPDVKAEDYRRIATAYKGTDAARQASFLAAGAMFAEGRYEEARVAFDKYVHDYPKDPMSGSAALGLAAALESLRKPDEALAAYQNVVSRYPNDAVTAQAKLALGRLYEAKGQPEAAMKIYQEMAKPTAMSAWSGDFVRRQDELLRRHPELTPKVVPPAATNVFSVPGVTPPPAAVTAPVPAPVTPATPAPAPEAKKK
ncbi:MAG TPA: tetratricopeptide repeat protein [Verrucomicrobiae bacterium]|jgi:tetratricopeptide (TPR) repeat protein